MFFSLFLDTYEPDGYNPEAPSITSTGRSQYRQFFSRTPMQRPNLIGLTSGEMDTNPRGVISYMKTLRVWNIVTNCREAEKVREGQLFTSN